jgi:probable rRNA maturation factor
MIATAKRRAGPGDGKLTGQMNDTKSRSPAFAEDDTQFEIDILIEAGDWAGERVLEVMARRAFDAGFAAAGIGPGRTEVSLVFTDDAHIRSLNAAWRKKDKATNVLSFPAFPGRHRDTLPPMLGDIVLALETIAGEAALEGKPFEHHLTHLVIHGLLHLLGYDHETEAEAKEMEATERRALARLAIPNPYA